MCADKRVVLKHVEAQNSDKKIKYWVQLVTPDLYEMVLDFMTKYFIGREPMNNYYEMDKDPQSVLDLQNLWKESVTDGAAIVAVLDNGKGCIPSNIIGANITAIMHVDDKDEGEVKGESFRRVIAVVDDITKKGNLFEKYNVDRYLTAYGLTVSPDYHGLGIGLTLLECREQVCSLFTITMTATVFTAASSQHLARKSGFHVVLEADYKSYEVDGQIYFPKLAGKISLMAKVFN